MHRGVAVVAVPLVGRVPVAVRVRHAVFVDHAIAIVVGAVIARLGRARMHRGVAVIAVRTLHGPARARVAAPLRGGVEAVAIAVGVDVPGGGRADGGVEVVAVHIGGNAVAVEIRHLRVDRGVVGSPIRRLRGDRRARGEREQRGHRRRLAHPHRCPRVREEGGGRNGRRGLIEGFARLAPNARVRW
jgi:hypothetical protein